MTTSLSNPWDHGTHSDLISIGTHSLYLSSAGTDRQPGEPMVLLMQGIGSFVEEWVTVRRLVLPFARWLQYDRTGQGRSGSPPDEPDAISAISVAQDLDTLLSNAGVAGPFIVVCHSWGGITSREFLHLRQDDVVGMVFVDANTEKSFDGGNWPLPYWNAVIKDINWVEASGLAAARVLSDEEWGAVLRLQKDPRHLRTEAAEEKGFKTDLAPLVAKNHFVKQILGDKPISVIRGNTPRDFQRVYDAGVAAGNGTEEERALCRAWLEQAEEKDERWQKEILRLSSVGRYVRTETSGHNVQIVEPELVADEIRWVWEQVKASRSV